MRRRVVDHLPELIRTLGLVMIIGHRQLGAEQKVTDRVLVKNAVDEDPVPMLLKVDAMIAAAVTVQGPSVAPDRAEVGSVERVQVGGKDLELCQEVELEILW